MPRQKRAIIFHGTDGTPADYWYPWLAQRLEARGYSVEVPSYPNINHEPVASFLPEVLKRHVFDEQTVLIGHSAGGPLVLSILEHIDITLPQAILVAGYARPLPGEGQDPILQSSYSWDRIRGNVKDIVLINSTDDPWGCDDSQGRFMFKNLGGTQIIREDGHFGSAAFKQQYSVFPLLERLIA